MKLREPALADTGYTQAELIAASELILRSASVIIEQAKDYRSRINYFLSLPDTQRPFTPLAGIYISELDAHKIVLIWEARVLPVDRAILGRAYLTGTLTFEDLFKWSRPTAAQLRDAGTYFTGSKADIEALYSGSAIELIRRLYSYEASLEGNERLIRHNGNHMLVSCRPRQKDNYHARVFCSLPRDDFDNRMLIFFEGLCIRVFPYSSPSI